MTIASRSRKGATRNGHSFPTRDHVSRLAASGVALTTAVIGLALEVAGGLGSGVDTALPGGGGS